MKLYLAGRYEDKKFIRFVASCLESVGHIIISDWFYEPDDYDDISERMSNDTTTPEDEKVLEMICLNDIKQVQCSDALVLFNRRGPSRGGSVAEMMVAIENNKPVYLIGPKINLFTRHPLVRVVDSVLDIKLEKNNGTRKD